MCPAFVGVAGLNMAVSGCTSTIAPFASVKPCGAFINAFTVMMKKAEAVEPITTGIENNQWIYGFLKRSQVYK